MKSKYCSSVLHNEMNTAPKNSKLIALVFSAFASWSTVSMEHLNADTPVVRADRWENTEAFFPGNYYFRIGTENFRAGRIEAAIEMWQLSARNAKKEAQFNLGLLYFTGEAMTPNRALGLAWFRLAAERGDEQFESALRLAWSNASTEERKGAEAEWNRLKVVYADAIAVPRADRAFRSKLNSITGSRLGISSNHVTSNFANGTSSDMAWVIREALQERRIYFNEVKGIASVGELIPIEVPPDSGK